VGASIAEGAEVYLVFNVLLFIQADVADGDLVVLGLEEGKGEKLQFCTY